MNLRTLPMLAAIVLSPLVEASAKPPSVAKTDARPSPAATGEGQGSLLQWLLLQNGGSTAATLPWPEVVRAASGRQVPPLDLANPSDAATLGRLGAALDVVLPRLNRPDGPLRAASLLTTAEFCARVADELRAALASATGKVETAENPADASCPLLRWTESPGGRTFSLVISVHPAGGKDGSLRALSVRAADLAGQITTDGPCLLVGVEHNGKSGRDLALLDWEVIDLARVSLRCAVTFEAGADALHVPGAAVADGRRGRD